MVDALALRQIRCLLMQERFWKSPPQFSIRGRSQQVLILNGCIHYYYYGSPASWAHNIAGYLSAHVLTCLIPAFFIAGAIAALLKTEMVLKYFGKDAPKWFML